MCGVSYIVCFVMCYVMCVQGLLEKSIQSSAKLLSYEILSLHVDFHQSQAQRLWQACKCALVDYGLPHKERTVDGRDYNRMLGMRYKEHLANLYNPCEQYEWHDWTCNSPQFIMQQF